jgi:type II secretory pathway component PulM
MDDTLLHKILMSGLIVFLLVTVFLSIWATSLSRNERAYKIVSTALGVSFGAWLLMAAGIMLNLLWAP